MAAPPCDGCGDERTLFMVNNVDTGASSYFGMLCLTMLSLTTMKEADEEGLDEAVKALGYQPTAAEKKRRTAALNPGLDPTRTIATITEDRPRPPGDESASGESDQSVSSFVDKAPDGGNHRDPDESDDLPGMRTELAESGPRPDVDDPAPY